MSGPLNATWNIGSTGGLISLTMGALVAGMVDRVQPYVFKACQQLGNTIPMCDATMEIIRNKVVPPPEKQRIKFLKAFVGFPTNDCASEFSQSQDGLRFLSLAAALLCSMKVSDAKLYLEALMTDAVSKAANDSSVVPKPQLLKDLLAALEPRCTAAGFSDLTLTWHFRIHRQASLTPLDYMNDTNEAVALPDPDGIAKLIAAFRKLYRIGDAKAKRVIIRSSRCTAWVASFTEWCLGVSPEIYTSSGEHLWSEHHHGVCIIHFPANDVPTPTPSLGVQVDETIRSFEELMSDDAARMDCYVNLRWRGMPSIDEYGKWLQRNNGFGSASNKRVLEQLIPHAVQQVITKLRFSTYAEFHYDRGLEGWLPAGQFLNNMTPSDHLPDNLQELRFHPFQEPNVEKMLFHLTSLKIVSKDSRYRELLENGGRIKDLPLVQHHLKNLSLLCNCFKCRGPRLSDEEVYRYCKRDAFFDKACNIVADILALSLFEYPEELHIRIPMRYHANRRHEFTRSIYHILTTGGLTVTNSSLLLDWALTLVGHDLTSHLKAHEWAASSYLGQAVWPTIFDTMTLSKHGFLSLKHQRGVFHYGKESYTLIETFYDDYEAPTTNHERTDTSEFVESGNFFRGAKVDWRVKIADDTLKVGWGLKGVDHKLAYVTVSPGRALANISSALLVENCPHEMATKLATRLDRPDPAAIHTHPLDPGKPLRSDEIEPSLVAVVP
ncbi:hypothetical protein KXV95_004987, partial [Aspergillus fumigatus]